MRAICEKIGRCPFGVFPPTQAEEKEKEAMTLYQIKVAVAVVVMIGIVVLLAQGPLP